MSVVLLEPLALALVLLAALPLAAWYLAQRRAQRVRRVLGLTDVPPRAQLAAPVAIVVVAGLVAVAAAQPVLARADEQRVRRGAEAFFVFDVSRSMLAAPSRDARTRLDRAIALSQELRATIPDVRVGVASFTDRVVPHLFPTTSARAFATTVERALAIERPPPGGTDTISTDLGVLASIEPQNYFNRGATRRLMIVLTDGETRLETLPTLPHVFRARQGATEEAEARAVFIHVWDRDERVYGRNGVPEPGYQTHPWSRSTVERLGRTLGGDAFGEGELEAAGAALERLVGSGPVTGEQRVERRTHLAPYVLALAFLPLAFVLWSRNLYGASVVVPERRAAVERADVTRAVADAAVRPAA